MMNATCKNYDNSYMNKASPTVYLQFLFGIFLISLAPTFVKLTTLNPVTIGFYRVFFAGFILLIFSFVFREKFKLTGINKMPLILAGICFGFDLMLWHRSILFVGMGNATLLVNLQIFFLLMISMVFFKEKISPKVIVAAPLAFFGLYLVVEKNNQIVQSHYYFGVMLAIFAALFYSGYITFLRVSQRVSKPLPLMINLCIISFISSMTIAMVMLLQHISFAITNSKNLLLCIAYALSAQVIGWLLISRSLRYVSLNLAGFLLLLQPVLAYVWDYLLFYFKVNTLQLMGISLTLFAIYIAFVSQKNKPSIKRRSP